MDIGLEHGTLLTFGNPDFVKCASATGHQTSVTEDLVPHAESRPPRGRVHIVDTPSDNSKNTSVLVGVSGTDRMPFAGRRWSGRGADGTRGLCARWLRQVRGLRHA
jgi:hypothetical protein